MKIDDKQWRNIAIVAIIFIVIGLLIFVAGPRYRQSIANDVVVQVANQQTQTGDIFVYLNNTVTTLTLQQICSSGGT